MNIKVDIELNDKIEKLRELDVKKTVTGKSVIDVVDKTAFFNVNG